MPYKMNKLGIDNVKNEMTMKLEKYFLLLALGVFAFALQSCDDDDNDGISVPAELSNALAKEHPNAQRIEWEQKVHIMWLISMRTISKRRPGSPKTVYGR